MKVEDKPWCCRCHKRAGFKHRCQRCGHTHLECCTGYSASVVASARACSVRVGEMEGTDEERDRLAAACLLIDIEEIAGAEACALVECQGGWILLKAYGGKEGATVQCPSCNLDGSKPLVEMPEEVADA